MTPYRDGTGEHPLGAVRSVHRVLLADYLRAPRSWVGPMAIAVAGSAREFFLHEDAVDALVLVPQLAFAVMSLVLVPTLLFATEVWVREHGVVVRALGKRTREMRFDAIASVIPEGLRLRDGQLIALDARIEHLTALRVAVARELPPAGGAP